MRIAVDIDSVLADIIPHILPFLNHKYSTNLLPNQITEWDYPINGRSIGKDIKEWLAEPAFVVSMPEVEGAKDGVKKLSSGHKIVIATGRPDYCEKWTRIWLQGRFGPNHIIFSKKKTVQNLNCDILIDDSPGYLSSFIKSGGMGILFKQPWNENHVPKGTSFVAESWNDILDYIKTIEWREFG